MQGKTISLRVGDTQHLIPKIIISDDVSSSNTLHEALSQFDRRLFRVRVT